MTTFEDVTVREILKFGNSITQTELRYYDDFKVDFLLAHGVYIQGIRVDDTLVGIGGIYKTHGIHSTFYMVKKEFQGRGIGNIITKNNIDYAKGHRIPFLFYICSSDNLPVIKSVKKYGDKEVLNYKGKRYSYMPITFMGKIFGVTLPLMVRMFIRIRRNK